MLAARISGGSLTPREVACVAWAYARLQHPSPMLFRAILKHALREADRCVCQCMWAGCAVRGRIFRMKAVGV